MIKLIGISGEPLLFNVFNMPVVIGTSDGNSLIGGHYVRESPDEIQAIITSGLVQVLRHLSVELNRDAS